MTLAPLEATRARSVLLLLTGSRGVKNKLEYKDFSKPGLLFKRFVF